MDTPLTVDQTLTLIFDRTDSVRDLWNFYIIVALGVLGFVMQAGSWKSELRARWMLVAGFLLFAVSVLFSMLQTQGERRGLVDVLKSFDLPPAYDALDGAIIVWPTWVVVSFSVLIAAAVVLCILWLARGGEKPSGKA